MEVKVLGAGCATCREVERVVREAVAEAGVAATVAHVTDMQEIARHGVFQTPAVVVSGVVKSVGKVPAKADVLAWLR